MTPRVAAAPCSYGVFEFTVGRPGLPDGPALVEAIADGGYAGTELGPPGYLRTRAARSAALLAESRPGAGRRVPAAALRARGRLRRGHARARRDARPAERGRRGSRAAVVAARRRAAASRIACGSPAPSRSTPRRGSASDVSACSSTTPTARPSAAASAASRRRSTPTPAPTSRRRARSYALLEHMDTSLLGLCFDTGHTAFGGGDPLALLREAAELVNHVHFKDVDLELLARLHAEGKGLEEAWAAGVFCELGSGGAQRRRLPAAAALGGLRRLDRRRAGSRPRPRRGLRPRARVGRAQPRLAARARPLTRRRARRRGEHGSSQR